MEVSSFGVGCLSNKTMSGSECFWLSSPGCMMAAPVLSIRSSLTNDKRRHGLSRFLCEEEGHIPNTPSFLRLMLSYDQAYTHPGQGEWDHQSWLGLIKSPPGTAVGLWNTWGSSTWTKLTARSFCSTGVWADTWMNQRRPLGEKGGKHMPGSLMTPHIYWAFYTAQALL